jgi:hypothetical protein
VVGEVKDANPDEGYLNFILDPVKVVGPESAKGYEVRFVYTSTRPFTKKGADGVEVPVKGNPNKLAQYLRATGLAAKPQTNSEYIASVKAAKSKQFGFTADWEASNRDTGERIRGYNNFPDDGQGGKKAILHAGDTYTVSDRKGNIIETKTVIADVLFANLRLSYFQDPQRVSK